MSKLIECPYCKNKTTLVLRTLVQKKRKGLVRYRKCVKCKTVFTTSEEVNNGNGIAENT